MGSFGGHVLPGAIFLAIGVWWFFNFLKDFRKSRLSGVQYKSHCYYGIAEPILITVLTLIGVYVEARSTRFRLKPDLKEDPVNNLENLTHMLLYSFFTIYALGVFAERSGRAPQKTSHYLLGMAFFAEGILFYFHAMMQIGTEHRVHLCLLLVIFFQLIFVYAVALRPHNPLFGLARAMVCMLQGTWFIQIAYSLFDNPMVDETASPGLIDAASMILTLYFFCHWIVLMSICLIFATLATSPCCCVLQWVGSRGSQYGWSQVSSNDSNTSTRVNTNDRDHHQLNLSREGEEGQEDNMFDDSGDDSIMLHGTDARVHVDPGEIELGIMTR